MKNFILFIFLASYLSGFELQVVSYVSPQKFSGLWYEIARTPNSYQEKCVASSVEYLLREENKYDVYNRCFESQVGGKLIEYNGSAQPSEDDDNMAKIDMTYFWIFTKEYEVYYLDTGYNYAVVADRNFEQLWIMSRKPKMERKKLNNILALLEKKMDLKRLIFTPQDEKGRYR
jgi:apolipoprotein D and lipocalin family protein